MSYPLARFVREITAALLLGCCVAAHAQPVSPPPPLEHFFANPRFSRPAFSPDGRLLAIVMGTKGQRDALRVIDLETNKVHATASYRDADIASFQWVNNKRLVFNVADRSLAQGEIDVGPGLYAVNADGSEMRQLAQRHWNDRVDSQRMRVPLLPPTVFMSSQPGLQNSDIVYVNQGIYRDIDNTLAEVHLLALDTVTGRHTRVPGPAGTTGWLLDHKGEPRVATSSKEQIGTVHWRKPGSQEWKQLTTFNVFTGSEGAFNPMAFSADGNMYVMSNKGDKAAVHVFNATTGKVSAEPLIETTGYDFNGGLVMKDGVLQGFRYTTDALSTYWLDPAMSKLQAEIDAKLVGTINTITVPSRPETPWVMVTTFSDVLPTTILLYNTSTKAFQNIGNSHPDIKPEQMGRQEAVTYKARDGMNIPALLTLPKGQRKNLPLVVLVHGGPSVDGAAWGWDAESQFLASRGYAVLEPSFRGTTGLGYKHHQAGWRQWGLAMQDDVADGAKWAIQQGIADGNRICIAGASYGGYATLMGLINDPDLFKCGVSWLGVTDLTLLQKSHWLIENDMSDVYRKYGFPELVGDPVKDAEQFKKTSPLMQAARLKQPLLLSYGGADRRVPINHGTSFYEAVKRTNDKVEWVTYPNEGHGYALEENRFDFYRRVERFLERHIGKPAAPAK